MSDINQFSFFRSYYKALEKLPPDEIGKIVLTICKFFFEDEEIPEQEGIAGSILELIRPIVSKSKAKALAGKKGGESKPEANPKQTESKPETKDIQHPSKPEPIRRRKKEKEKEKENEKEKVSENKGGVGEKETTTSGSFFVIPSLRQVKAYFANPDGGEPLQIDPVEFHSHFEAKGWRMENGGVIPDWKKCARVLNTRAKRGGL